MAPIMKTASMKPEVALLDNDELNGVDNEAHDWQVHFFSNFRHNLAFLAFCLLFGTFLYFLATFGKTSELGLLSKERMS